MPHPRGETGTVIPLVAASTEQKRPFFFPRKPGKEANEVVWGCCGVLRCGFGCGCVWCLRFLVVFVLWLCFLPVTVVVCCVFAVFCSFLLLFVVFLLSLVVFAAVCCIFMVYLIIFVPRACSLSPSLSMTLVFCPLSLVSFIIFPVCSPCYPPITHLHAHIARTVIIVNVLVT